MSLKGIAVVIRFALCTIVLAGLSCLCTGKANRAQAAAAKPNIVFIMADDLGIGDLGYTGQNARAAAGLPAISTPNIDALAAQGVSFANMYSNPVCSPSRATLLTGFNEAHTLFKEASVYQQMRKEEVTFAEVLKQGGYSTGMVGKWHVGGVLNTTITGFDALPTQQGFDYAYGTLSGGWRNAKMWESDGTGGMKLVDNSPDPGWPGPGQPFEYTDDAHTDHAVQYIRNAAGQSQPFAAYVALQDPHEPYDWGPINPLYSNTGWNVTLQRYASMVTRVDTYVGRILQAIDDPNGDGNTSDSVAANTIVMFTSDNGARYPGGDGYNPEFFDSNGPYREYKSSTFEGGIKAPFLVRWPGVTQPGTVKSNFVGGLEDMLPTFAELAGQDLPLGVDGKSLVPAITGQGQVQASDVMAWTYPANVSNFNTNAWSVRVGDWKLTSRIPSGIFLHNIAADPLETTNLASSRPDIVNALQQVAYDEGFSRSAQMPHVNPPYISVTVIDWFNQYKTWSPSGASTDFLAAANWSGGTSTAGIQNEFAASKPAQNWDTGPAENWIALVANTTGGAKTAAVGANAKVLALEVRGDVGTMNVTLGAGVNLDARNGLRISAGGAFFMNGGTVRTNKKLEIHTGGSLVGAGLVTGWQQVIAGIPEFQGKGLFTPDVVNSGSLAIQNGSAAGLMTIDGNFQQDALGSLQIDLFSGGGVGGVDFDKLTVTGSALVSGAIDVDLKAGFNPFRGQSFNILSAANLTAMDLALSGPDAARFTMSVLGGTNLALKFVSADFDGNGMVNAADLTRWRQHFGLFSGALASEGDADGNGAVDAADFAIWQRQFGMANGLALGSTVPEPSSVFQALLLAVFGGKAFRAARRLAASSHQIKRTSVISYGN